MNNSDSIQWILTIKTPIGGILPLIRKKKIEFFREVDRRFTHFDTSEIIHDRLLRPSSTRFTATNATVSDSGIRNETPGPKDVPLAMSCEGLTNYWPGLDVESLGIVPQAHPVNHASHYLRHNLRKLIKTTFSAKFEIVSWPNFRGNKYGCVKLELRND